METLLWWMWAVGLALLAAAPLAVHFRLCSPPVGFSGWILGGIAVFSSLLISVWKLLEGGAGLPWPALGVALLVSGGLAYGLVLLLRFPFLNDVATEAPDPPRFRSGGTPSFGEPKRPASHAGPPLRSSLPPSQLFSLVLDLAGSQQEWQVTRVDAVRGEIEGYAESRVFRFPDLFALQVRASGQGSELHMRSRSCHGRSDLGRNAARIREFLREVEQRIGRKRSSPKRNPLS